MSSERIVIYEGTCECGEGTDIVIEDSPDHGWGSSTFYDTLVDCENCSKKYNIEEDGTEFYRIYTRTTEAKNRAIIEENAITKEMMSYLFRSGYYKAISDALNALPSAKAAYETLLTLHINKEPLSSFRHHFKRGQCTPEWCRRYFDGRYIQPIFSWTSISDQQADEMLEKITALKEIIHYKQSECGQLIFERGHRHF